MPPIRLSLTDLSQLVIRQTQSGRTRDEIAKGLVARGWPESSAVRFVDLTLAEHKEAEAEAEVSKRALDSSRSSGRRSAGIDSEWWQLILVVALLMASVILCSLFVYVR